MIEKYNETIEKLQQLDFVPENGAGGDSTRFWICFGFGVIINEYHINKVKEVIKSQYDNFEDFRYSIELEDFNETDGEEYILIISRSIK